MHIVLGGTGHVGAACATALLDDGEPVTIVGHDPAKAEPWRAKGAEIAIVDVTDTAALNAVFRRGRRAFLLNPPADVAGDTDVAERHTAAAIIAALAGSGLDAVVAASTYGAQPGERIGDLSVLHDFEQALAAQPIPATIQRGAYYMSNWDTMLAPARDTGVLPSFFPADLTMPMVAPADLGRAAARRLRAAPVRAIHHVEGPARYSAAEVAAAFAAALGRPVRVRVVPRDRWLRTYHDQGFSAPAADAYARMTAVAIDGGFVMPDDPERGATTLDAYIAARVARGRPFSPAPCPPSPSTPAA